MSHDRVGMSLTHSAYEKLRANLLAGRLQPGEKLKIKDLCETLSVSLSAVREALSRLTSEGLVVASPHRGFYAAPVSAADLQDLTQARIEIESLCLVQAIESGGVAWETGIVGTFHQLSRTVERTPDDPRRLNDAWTAAHAAFHAALVSECPNTWLLRLRNLLYAQSERYRHLSEAFSDTQRDVESEHLGIKEAVLARDADRACKLMAAHFRLTTHLVLNGRLASTFRPLDPPKNQRRTVSVAKRPRRRASLQAT